MIVLVTGGAGFIGSVTVEALLERGDTVIVLDNLSRGHVESVPKDVPFYPGDVADVDLVNRILDEHAIDACIHFAANAYPGESVTEPAMYFDNNLRKSLTLLETFRQRGMMKLVFSSTCAAFGEPDYVPIDETHPQRPPSPYGWSKMVFERAMESYDHAYGFRFVALRYFNACGATTTKGEDHDPEPHLLPLILWTAMGIRDSLKIFGTDYPTPDGSCIRDYVHVSDLAQAHLLALDHLRNDKKSEIFNLGNGTGFSVMECIAAVERVTGLAVRTESAPRRPGDASHLVADSTKAKTVLGWDPQVTDIDDIIRSSWEWFKTNPRGYQ